MHLKYLTIYSIYNQGMTNYRKQSVNVDGITSKGPDQTARMRRLV